MKKLIILAALLLPVGAFAYVTSAGSDPSVTPDKEYKAGVKSVVAGISDKIAAEGELLTYTSSNDGYTVTRVGAGGTSVWGSRGIAGVATKIVATGDTGYFLMQTRGYATVKYDASVGAQHPSAGIVRGDVLCANTVGAAIPCLHAASASKVIALEAKDNGTTGSNLKVLIRAD